MVKFNLLSSAVKPLNKNICELIKRRRRQLMVHSCIYYRLGTSIINDSQFDSWAYELKDLQKTYPNESKSVELYEDFKDWDGTTGYYLNTFNFLGIARALLNYKENYNEH